MTRGKIAIALLAAGSLSVRVSGWGSSGSGTPPPPQTYTLTINSSNPASGVQIGISENGSAVSKQDTAPATVTAVSSAAFVLTAPSTAGGNNFSSWTGCTSVSSKVCNVTLNADMTVTVNYAVTPTVTVTPASPSINTEQAVQVTVAVAGLAGDPTPSGSVVLSNGNGYTSAATTLSAGSAQFTIPAGSFTTSVGSLTVGLNTLTATYTPDSASAKIYGTATGTSPTIAVTAVTEVAVDQSSLGAAVTNQILGLNMAVYYDFTDNGAYTAKNSPIVSAFQSTGIAVLRWPGGSTSDVYHWNGTSASNPAKGAAPTPTTCNGSGENSNTNYLNFINDLEYADTALPKGFDVALTADYGTNPGCNGGGEPSEAANWVKYAYANGGTVSHVTVGNEVFGGWETDMHSTPHDPTTYANAVKGANGYYELIKAQRPSTLVGVVVDANWTAADYTHGWDSTVLANAVGCNGAGTPCYDFVEYHFAPQSPRYESDTFLTHQAAQALTAAVNTIKSELATAGKANTPIYVGEGGAVTSNAGKQTWSITQGLFAAQTLGEAMNDGVSRLTWWTGFGDCNGDNGNDSSSLYGWQNFGAENVFADAPGDSGGSNDKPCNYGGPIGTPSPTAIAFLLFSNVAVNGEHVLTPTVTGNTADVRAYAATHSGGTALVLFNLNETTAESVKVTLSKETKSPRVTEITYDKEMYDYTNTSCESDPTCTYNPAHNYRAIEWVLPASTSLGAQTLPLTLMLQPWSMNVVLVQ